MKKFISILLSVTVLFSTIVLGNLTALAECYHSNGDMGEYIETDYGFAQICPDCQGDYANFIHFEHNDFSEPKTVDLTPYNNNGTYTAEIALVSILPTSNVTLKLSEAIASDNNTYIILQTDYETFKDAFTSQDEEKMANLESTIIFSGEGYELPTTVDLCAGQEYLLFDGNWTATANFGSLKLAYADFKGVVKTNDNWEYSTDGTLKKYLGNDKNVVIPQSIDETDICDVEPDLFNNNEEFDTIKVENLSIKNIDFIASCKYVEEVYTHDKRAYSIDEKLLEEKYGAFLSLCSEYAIPENENEDCTKSNYGKCSVCGYKGYLLRRSHDYSVFIEHIDGIEGQEEGDLYRCAYCQKTKLLNANHNYVYKETVKHTCTQDGYDVYECQGCGDIENRPNGDKAQHDYFLAFWDGEGEHYYCNNCTESKTEEHNYKKVVIPPTETQHGYTEYECENCNYSYRSNETETSEHIYVKVETVAPDCENRGYTEYKCENCDDTYLGDFVDSLGHDYIEYVFPATCVSDEYIKYECSRCNFYYYSEGTQHSYGHNYEDVRVSSDGCDYIEPICSRCGEPENFPHKNDDFNNYEIELVDISLPVNFCGSQGYKLYRAFDKTSDYSCEFRQPLYNVHQVHEYTSKIIEPTCLDCGYIEYTCKWCDHFYKNVYDNSLGHNSVEQIVPATQNTKGYTYCYCDRCGELLGDKFNYVPESKYDFTGNVRKAIQNSAVVFTDGDYYYVMLWEKGKDFCEFSYSTNDDGSINFTIRSDTTCIIPDEDYAGRWNYSSSMPMDNVSTAYLYKYVDGTWLRVRDGWVDDSRFGFYVENKRGRYPRLYSMSFDHIKANTISDIILWYKDDYPYNHDNVSCLDLSGYQSMTWDRFYQRYPVVNRCSECNSLVNMYRSIFNDDKHLVVVNEDLFDEETSTGVAYDICNTYDHIGIEDDYKLFSELNEEHSFVQGHISFYPQYHSRQFWNDEYPYSCGHIINRSKRLSHNVDVIVNYLDVDGNELTDNIILKSRLFDEYETEAKVFEGYQLVANPDNACGILTDEDVVVNYVYEVKQEVTEPVDPLPSEPTEEPTTEEPTTEEPTTEEPTTENPIEETIETTTDLTDDFVTEQSTTKEYDTDDNVVEKCDKSMKSPNTGCDDVIVAIIMSLFVLVGALIFVQIMHYKKKINDS